MALIFDAQGHPGGGLIFDLQDYAAGFGSSSISLTPQGSVIYGRGMDTDQQIVVYPQGSITYTPYQAVVINGTVATSFIPAAAISYTPQLAVNYAVAGAVQVQLTPFAAFGYGTSYNVDGTCSTSFTPIASITYRPAEDAVVLCAFLLDNAVIKKRRRAVLEEKSAALLTLNFVDALGVGAATPQSITYRIDCRTTGTVIRAVQALLPAASLVVKLTAADTVIVDANNVRELRRVTVQAAYASGEAVTAQFDYLVRNFSGVV